MSSRFQAIGDPRHIGDITIQYVGSSAHSHEGGHRITVVGRELLALPDGQSTARKRSHALSEALHAASEGIPDLLALSVGALVLAGARNIEVDGVSLFANGPRRVASLRLDVNEIGDAIEVSVAHLGNS
jgi:hypothetical protein